MEQRVKIARWVLMAGIVALPVVVWDNFLFASTVAKTFFIYFCIDGALALALPEAVITLKRIMTTWVGRFVLLWFCVAFFASLVGANFYHSVWPGYERMMGLWTIGHLVLLFVLLVTLMRSQDWRTLWLGVIGIGVFVSVIGIVELLRAGEYIRIESTFRNSAFLAAYLIIIVCAIGAALMETERHIWRIGVLGAGFLLVIVALVLTGSRSAFVALGGGGLAGALMVLFLMPQERTMLSFGQKTWRKIILASFVVIVCTLVAGFLFRGELAQSSNGLLRRFGQLSLSDRTVSGRALAWRIATEGWKEHPFFGVGIENFYFVFNTHYDPALYPQEPWFDRAHSVIFDTLVTTGLVGLMVYAALIVVAVGSTIRALRRGSISFPWAVGAVMMILGTVVQNLFFFDTITVVVLFYVVLAYVASASMDSSQDEKKYRPSMAMIAMSVAVSAVLLWVGVVRPLYENYLGRIAYDAFAAGNDAAGYQYVEAALAQSTYGDIDVRRGIAEYAFDFIKRGGKRSPEAMHALLQYNAKKMEENIIADPLDVKWLMYQGEFLNIMAVYFDVPDKEAASQAERRFVEAARLSPGRHQIYLEIAQARRITGDIAGMWDVLEKAESLTPEYTLPHTNALVQAIELGDVDREQRERLWLEQYGWKRTEGEDPGRDLQNIRDAYFRSGHFVGAADFQERYVMLLISVGVDVRDPSLMSKQYAALADLERRAGNNDKAREAALNAFKLDPTLKDQVDAFLKMLR